MHNKIDRLLTAYQEELITLEQFRQRMPKVQQQEQALRSELQSLHMATQDQSRYLRVVDILSDFRARLQGNADHLDFIGGRKIIRLLVKEILVGTDTITIRHSIPLPHSKPLPTDPTPPRAGPGIAVFRAEWEKEVDRIHNLRKAPPITQGEVIQVVNNFMLPSDIMVCAAGSLPGDMHKLWRRCQPGGYHLEYGYSCMGYEIAGGLGAKMADPREEKCSCLWATDPT